jgi:hypothetical protein
MTPSGVAPRNFCGTFIPLSRAAPHQRSLFRMVQAYQLFACASSRTRFKDFWRGERCGRDAPPQGWCRGHRRFASRREATAGDLGASSRCTDAGRVTHPRIGWVLGVPCLSLRTCRVAVLNSTCSPLQVHSSVLEAVSAGHKDNPGNS